MTLQRRQRRQEVTAAMLTLSDGSTYSPNGNHVDCHDKTGHHYWRGIDYWPTQLEELARWPDATPADLAAIHRAACVHAVGEAQADAVTVRPVRLIGTTCDVYTAWLPMPDCTLFDHPYGTISFFGASVLHGALGTERLPADLDALPSRTEERYQAVTAWHKRMCAAAYAVIVTKYPGITAYACDRAYGHISVETSWPIPF